MGDNRDQSLDSRFFGLIKADKILGKVKRVYFSWDNATKGVRWDRLDILVR
jgi:signal peptidase I